MSVKQDIKSAIVSFPIDSDTNIVSYKTELEKAFDDIMNKLYTENMKLLQSAQDPNLDSKSITPKNN